MPIIQSHLIFQPFVQIFCLVYLLPLFITSSVCDNVFVPGTDTFSENTDWGKWNCVLLEMKRVQLFYHMQILIKTSLNSDNLRMFWKVVIHYSPLED